MCGIIGIFGNKQAKKLAQAMLESIKERGKDGEGIYGDSKNLLGHNLHSVVSNIKQPLIGKGRLVANCEIYNWKELNKKYSLKAKNDAEVLLKLLDKKGLKAIEELDGDYAFAYWNKNKVLIVRDIIGVKPIWYSFEKGLYFASEKKALEKIKRKNIIELNPRIILEYNIKTKKLEKKYKGFFETKPENKGNIKSETKKLLLEAIKKRIPSGKFGILFSGGVDSAFLALICKQLKKDFICYTTAFKEEGLQEAEDVTYAKKIAKELKLNHKIINIGLKEAEEYYKKVVPLMEDYNAIKAGVAVTLYAACEKAKKDGIKVIFSGLGSEQIFGGYEKHKRATDLNQECLSGIRIIYEKDTYRDDVVSMANNLEMRVPFLDLALVKYALKIPKEMKANEKGNKMILREIATDMGLKEEYSMRKKRAAQYGSKTDQALRKLIKKNKSKSRTDYLQQFYKGENARLGGLFSSGKDSTYAIHTMQRQGYPVKCLIVMKSKDKFSWMFHTPNIDLVKYQAEAMQLPLLEQKTLGRKEAELKDLKKAIEKAVKKYKIEGIITGALYSTYQRNRIEQICDELGLKIFSPLWHMEQENLVRNMVREGFEIVISSIAADGLNKKWLGRKLDMQAIDELKKLNEKNGLNVAFEGGEAETTVINAPNFNKKIIIKDAKIIMENECTGLYKIKKIKLE